MFTSWCVRIKRVLNNERDYLVENESECICEQSYTEIQHLLYYSCKVKRVYKTFLI